MGEPEIREFLTHLAVERHVSASTQNQAMCAVLFLYKEVLNVEELACSLTERAQRPARLPVALTKEEVRAIFNRLTGPARLISGLLYGAGLRLMECLTLRARDLDFVRNEIVVHNGKGQKDRVTMLPEIMKESLSIHLQNAKVLHERDLLQGAGRVALPDAIAKVPQRGPRMGMAMGISGNQPVS